MCIFTRLPYNKIHTEIIQTHVIINTYFGVNWAIGLHYKTVKLNPRDCIVLYHSKQSVHCKDNANTDLYVH